LFFHPSFKGGANVGGEGKFATPLAAKIFDFFRQEASSGRLLLSLEIDFQFFSVSRSPKALLNFHTQTWN